MQQQPPPDKVLLQMITGYWASMSIHVVAKLGIADLLAGGPKTSDELAQATKTHPHSLYRLLRAVASVGIFAEIDGKKFQNTTMSEMLLDKPGSKRWVAIMMGDEHFRSWGDLLYSVQTGRTAFDHIYGKPVFDFLSEHPEQARIFDNAMTGFHGPETQAMIDAYDFSPFGTVADVGGGIGLVLATILKKTPNLKGMLYDLPGVIERANANLKAEGVSARCQTIAGSFFESIPPGADAYLMRHIIHDWNDDQCRTILSNIRKVIPPTGKLLVIEMVIQSGNAPTPAKFLDLNMLVIPGGMERTEAEYRELFQSAGFRLTRVIPTTTEVSIVEAVPA